MERGELSPSRPEAGPSTPCGEALSPEEAAGAPREEGGPIRLEAPLERERLAPLRAGDRILLSGRILTARDAAHRRLIEGLDRGEGLPFDPRGAAIYYAGPAPARPGRLIGPVGPTTSGRMDATAPALHRLGVAATIGKGRRSEEVVRAIRETGSVYLGATGGAAALLARRVRSVRPVAFEDLGPEAILELTVEDFPLVVLIDVRGNDLYRIGPEEFRRRG